MNKANRITQDSQQPQVELTDLIWAPTPEQEARSWDRSRKVFLRGHADHAMRRALKVNEFQPAGFWKYLQDLATTANANLEAWSELYGLTLGGTIVADAVTPAIRSLQGIGLARGQAAQVLRMTIAEQRGFSVLLYQAARGGLSHSKDHHCRIHLIDAESQYDEAGRRELVSVLDAIERVYGEAR